MALNLNKNYILFITLLYVFSAILPLLRADDMEEEDCGNGCQSYDQDTSQMTRCVRYACRRRVFRYFIRFGKRSGMTSDELAREMQKLQVPLHPLYERLSRRYLKQEMTSHNRNRQPVASDKENKKRSSNRQIGDNYKLQQVQNLQSNQQRKVNLLKTILIHSRL
ncbi:hypothetical protein Bpfe_026067 [Biomphalaria pfeifferi]|uniref:Uncharacterized protein n=1 Tax=Biomphalaria pfeifferi TaxID=112525 RepID=A0AAD8AXY4_BIOPF|nr:hypothetical protein Bpfe_026067 [Biomphalaria pfeifferi]